MVLCVVLCMIAHIAHTQSYKRYSGIVGVPDIIEATDKHWKAVSLLSASYSSVIFHSLIFTLHVVVRLPFLVLHLDSIYMDSCTQDAVKEPTYINN